jgi:hypothetical protein
MRSYTCPICHSVFAEADEQWDRLQASGFRCPACTRIPRRRLARIGLGLLVIGMTSCLNAMYTPFDERMRFLRQPNTVLEAWLRQQAPQPGSSMQQVRSFTERKGWKQEGARRRQLSHHRHWPIRQLRAVSDTDSEPRHGASDMAF